MEEIGGQAEGLLLVRIDQQVIGRLAVGNETQFGRVSLALVHHALSSWHLSEPMAKVDHASPVVALDVPKRRGIFNRAATPALPCHQS